MAGEINEKCAVSAIVSDGEPASPFVYESLRLMQHRGEEASGIASQPDNCALQTHRKEGLVFDVYSRTDLERLAGSVAIGHNRYSTDGKERHPQPYEDPALGLAFAHNGNLPVIEPLKEFLANGGIKIENYNDSEMMGLAIAQYMRGGLELPDAIEKAYPLFGGAFSCVAMQGDVAVAFKDSKGIKPLAFAQFDDKRAIASETCGLDVDGAKYVREIEPGEMMIITKDSVEPRQIAEGQPKLDMFEFVYFSKHDSYLYGQRVNEVRRRFGQRLAVEHPPITDDCDKVLVIPVPDTSVPAAQAYAHKLGLELRNSLIKDRFIGRTFMQPTNELRVQQLKRKLILITEDVVDRDVIYIDDSIVRLNTMPGLIEKAQKAGARSVTVLVASAPYRFPDFYGTDTPNQKKLAAANMTVEQMRNEINCLYLGYLSLSGMVEATGLPADMFNLSCFNGDYPIDIGANKDKIYAPVSMEFTE